MGFFKPDLLLDYFGKVQNVALPFALTVTWSCGIIHETKAVKRTSTFAKTVSEPGIVRAGQKCRSKIISEPRAENRVSKPELFSVTGTG